MAWLFERTIELAAWVAFALGVICLIDSVYLLVQWGRAWMDQDSTGDLLFQSGRAAGGFVLASLAMGALACIDRYVFDLPEEPVAKR
ncbi:MAG: hypothetical protein DCC67_06100 [Planctomycetota bacterium]|nr:MAG: hypothetical protein DCC67_06100 [Planctomycetota bacterium]